MNSTNHMTILVTCDLHQWIEKWAQLVKAVGKEKPRFVLIAGDLLPKTGGYAAQKDFFPEVEPLLPRNETARPGHRADVFG